LSARRPTRSPAINHRASGNGSGIRTRIGAVSLARRSTDGVLAQAGAFHSRLKVCRRGSRSRHDSWRARSWRATSEPVGPSRPSTYSGRIAHGRGRAGSERGPELDGRERSDPQHIPALPRHE
jgi:hypothetical protein